MELILNEEDILKILKTKFKNIKEIITNVKNLKIRIILENEIFLKDNLFEDELASAKEKIKKIKSTIIDDKEKLEPVKHKLNVPSMSRKRNMVKL